MAQIKGYNKDNENASDTAGGFPLIPKGRYTVLVEKAEQQDSQYGNVLSLTLQIIEGDYRGRLVWDRIYTDGDDDEKRNKSDFRIQKYFKAVGKPDSNDSDDLVGSPFVVSLNGTERKGEGKHEGKVFQNYWITPIVDEAAINRDLNQPSGAESSDSDDIPF